MITSDQIHEAVKTAEFPAAYGEAFARGLNRRLANVNFWLESLTITDVVEWLSAGVFEGLSFAITDDVLYPCLERFFNALFANDEPRKWIALEGVKQFRSTFTEETTG